MFKKAKPVRIAGWVLLLACTILGICVLVHLARFQDGVCVDGKLVFSIEQDSITGDGLSYLLTNFDGATHGYGQAFYIEQKRDGGWEELPHIGTGIGWTLAQDSLLPYESRQYSIDWSALYGTLPPGTYRLVKEFDQTRYGAEFTIA